MGFCSTGVLRLALYVQAQQATAKHAIINRFFNSKTSQIAPRTHKPPTLPRGAGDQKVVLSHIESALLTAKARREEVPPL